MGFRDLSIQNSWLCLSDKIILYIYSKYLLFWWNETSIMDLKPTIYHFTKHGYLIITRLVYTTKTFKYSFSQCHFSVIVYGIYLVYRIGFIPVHKGQ